MADYRQNGSKGYLLGIVLVAVIGGLLFGYDTAVISGAEQGLQSFFSSASDFQYSDAIHGFTTSSALIGCIIGAFVSGIIAARFGRKKSLFLAGILFFVSALLWYVFVRSFAFRFLRFVFWSFLFLYRFLCRNLLAWCFFFLFRYLFCLCTFRFWFGIFLILCVWFVNRFIYIIF